MSNGPMINRHTTKNLYDSSHYKNLKKAENQINVIVNKINLILESLNESSGSEVEKWVNDLNKVKSSFQSVNDSINSRINKMVKRANDYDDLYDLFEKKYPKGTLLKTNSSKYNEVYAGSLVWGNNSFDKS